MTPLEKNAKGHVTITIPLAIAFTGTTLLISGLSAYFSSQLQIQAKVNDVRVDLSKDISVDRENIATLQEAIDTIKKSQSQTESDIKEVLRILK